MTASCEYSQIKKSYPPARAITIMSTSAPGGSYTFLRAADEFASLVDRYDNFLFGMPLY